MTCVLTVMHWDGDFPLPGEFVKSRQGRTAYMIVDVKICTGRTVAKFICERYTAANLGDNAVVHEWCWAKR
jgi:hypothetical protein